MSKTQLVGILNITPDSFSDGGCFVEVDKALQQVKRLMAEGASVIDIGAESTRPGAVPLTAEEEWTRLEPLLFALRDVENIRISLDTRHAETARKALASEVVHWINDVSGVSDPAMLDVLLEYPVPVVVMHHLGIPADKNITLPQDSDPVEEVYGWLASTRDRLVQAGIIPSNIILDIGIGFGKTAQQSMQLLQRIEAFKTLELPLMVGHSRKSFLSLISNTPADQRDPETAQTSAYLASKGIEYVRVHDVAMSARAIKLAEYLDEH